MKKLLILTLFIGMLLAKSHSSSNHEVKIDTSDTILSPLIVKDSEYKLIFFGYAGCYHFCDPRLRLIDLIYKNVSSKMDLKVLFIDIAQESTLDDSRRFVKDVNEAFDAIHPKSDALEELQQQFKDLFIRKMPQGEYLHSGFLYLLKKEANNYILLKTYLEFDNTTAVSANILKVIAR